MRRRRQGQTTVEAIIGLVAFASIIVATMQVIEAITERMRVESVRQEAAAAIVAGPAASAPDRLDETASAVAARWTNGPTIASTGGCDPGFPSTDVSAIDDAQRALRVTVAVHGVLHGYGSPMDIDESLCVGAGTARRSDLGGDLIDVDPTFWGAGARATLEALYN